MNSEALVSSMADLGDLPVNTWLAFNAYCLYLDYSPYPFAFPPSS
jgi:hypothetical protein